MAKLESINPRRILPRKCDVCNRNSATKEIVFDYGFKLKLCDKDYSDLKKVCQQGSG
jgi:hypothetical protein